MGNPSNISYRILDFFLIREEDYHANLTKVKLVASKILKCSDFDQNVCVCVGISHTLIHCA